MSPLSTAKCPDGVDLQPSSSHSLLEGSSSLPSNATSNVLEDAANYVGLICGRIAATVFKEHKQSLHGTEDCDKGMKYLATKEYVKPVVDNIEQ